MTTLEYTDNDINAEFINKNTNFSNKTKFDELLCNEWTNAMNMGYFKYRLDENKTRISQDKYNFIFQLNTKRFTEKRKAELINKVDMPFNNDKFNFTKIKDEEILFSLRKDNVNHDDDTVVIINNSPIEFGHVLLVPRRHSCLNQVLDLHAIQTAIEMLLLSNHYGFFVGFNSLCALASVNHLHFHAYFLDHTLPIQRVKGTNLCDKLWTLDTYMLPGLVLQLCDFKNKIDLFAKAIYSITDYFNNNNVAHNVMFVKGENIDTRNKEQITVRAILWPRKAFLGSKDEDTELKFHLAICELSGHVVIRDEETFNSISECEVESAVEKIKLETTMMNKIIDDIKKIILGI